MSNQRIAIVTGASRGIGAAIARRLAADGVAIVVNYSGRVADAEKVVAEIKSTGGHAIAVQADVADAQALEKLFDQTEAEFGGVDILVNNAGVIQPGLVPVADTDDALFNRIFDTNAKGTFHGLRLAAKRLRTGGRIVNFSSSLVGLCMPGTAIYSAAKAAIETMTNIYAKELRGRQITVNCVAPGPTATDLFLTGKTPQVIEQMSKAPPLERLGKPEDIAGVVAFLCSAEGGWVNGQTLRANGGLI